MITKTPSLTQILSLFVCLLLSGCGTTGLNFSSKSAKMDKETPDNPVEQIVPVWQEADGPSINPKQVTRGFGGQVYFITRGRGVPSEVNGKVRIYLFDDQGPIEERSKPIHQFDFEPGAWKAHLITTKLGPAYSVFIPYTRSGHALTECALRIRYTPEDGAPVFSQMVKMTLDGTKKPAETETIIKPDTGAPVEETGPAIPQVSRRGRKPASKIEQASAEGDLIERTGVQTANHETPAGRNRDQGRIRAADYEEEDEEQAPAKPRRYVGDENLDFLGNEADDDAEQMPVRRKEPRRIKTSRRTEELPFDEPDAEADTPKLRTYTIPLNN